MNGMQSAVEPDGPGGSAAARRSEDERHLRTVIADLWQHSETLVRQELELLRTEYEARVTYAKKSVERGAISLGLFHAAYLASLATLVLVLSLWVAPWLAALFVALSAAGGALLFTHLSKRALEAALEPHETKKTKIAQAPRSTFIKESAYGYRED